MPFCNLLKKVVLANIVYATAEPRNPKTRYTKTSSLIPRTLVPRTSIPGSSKSCATKTCTTKSCTLTSGSLYPDTLRTNTRTANISAAITSKSNACKGPSASLREVLTGMARTILFGFFACTATVAVAGNVASTNAHTTEHEVDSGAAANTTHADKPVSKEVLWKRAIDRDDTNAIRHLLNEVDIKLPNDKGKTALMAAAKTGQLDLLETLLELGLQLDDRSFTGGTSLMYAALGRQYSMIRYLLNAKRGASDFQLYVDAASTNGWTAAMIAAAKGFDRVLKQLVEEGDADVWLADAYQWTPLMRAIDNRHTAVVQYLLSLDQPALNRTNENGATALHVAVERGDVATARQLLARNIDPDIRDSAQRTARDIAISRDDESMIEALSG